jgi:voltage-gated potassium channel
MSREERLRRFVQLSEWPLALMALALIPPLLLDDSHVGRWHQWSETLNWVVWLVFCTELGVKAWLTHDTRNFLRHSWFDLLIVVFSPPFLGPEYLQGVRALRAVRVVRLLRFVRVLRVLAIVGIAVESARDALQHRRFHYVVAITTIIVSVGALAIFAVENGQNPSIASLGDAFWWAIVTATTVGYGDVSPKTTEGRLIAVALMLVGIGFIGVFTATVASFFFDQDKTQSVNELAQLKASLARVEQKQDELLKRLSERVF